MSTPVRPHDKKIHVMLAIQGLHHGGAERVIASLCNHLDKKRFSVIVCWRLARGAIGEELMAQGYEVVGLPEVEPQVGPYRRFLVLKRLLRERDVDVLHTHDTGALADGAQCRLAGAKAKLVHTFHFGNYPLLPTRYRLMEMAFGRMADHLVAVGYEQAKQIHKTLHLSPEKVDVIHNGVAEPIYDEMPALLKPYRDRPDRPVIIGSISTLIEQKGLPFLLEAAAILRQSHKDFILLIVGDGPLRPMLEKRCEQLGLNETVHFLGWVPHAASHVLPFLDIFCQSSLWEANSIVLLEAMAVGVPIVTTEVGESRHVLKEGGTGRIVRPRDPMALAQALSDIIKRKELREDMGRRARQAFVDQFTVDKMVARYQRLYESLV